MKRSNTTVQTARRLALQRFAVGVAQSERVETMPVVQPEHGFQRFAERGQSRQCQHPAQPVL